MANTPHRQHRYTPIQPLRTVAQPPPSIDPSTPATSSTSTPPLHLAHSHPVQRAPSSTNTIPVTHNLMLSSTPVQNTSLNTLPSSTHSTTNSTALDASVVHGVQQVSISPDAQLVPTAQARSEINTSRKQTHSTESLPVQTQQLHPPHLHVAPIDHLPHVQTLTNPTTITITTTTTSSSTKQHLPNIQQPDSKPGPTPSNITPTPSKSNPNTTTLSAQIPNALSKPPSHLTPTKRNAASLEHNQQRVSHEQQQLEPSSIKRPKLATHRSQVSPMALDQTQNQKQQPSQPGRSATAPTPASPKSASPKSASPKSTSPTTSNQSSVASSASDAPPNEAPPTVALVSLPMLRSSPVDAARSASPPSKPQKSVTSAPMLISKRVEDVVSDASSPADVSNPAIEKQASDADSTSKTSPKPEKKKKQKTISWAQPENLEEVHYIDTRSDLIRSWHPDFQITLPFAPATLQMFLAARAAEAAAQNSGNEDGGANKGAPQIRSKPKLSTFEEARKREHEMELERARRAREEQNRRLDAMCAKRPWRKPFAIVLPAECRKDPAEIEEFNVIEEDHPAPVLQIERNRTTPLSPVLRNRVPRASHLVKVPVIPLSDGNSKEEDTYRSQASTYTSQQSSQDYYAGTNSTSYAGNKDGANYVGQTNPSYGSNRNYSSRNVISQTEDRNSQANYNDGSKETSNYQNPILGFNRTNVQHILTLLKESGVLNAKTNVSNQSQVMRHGRIPSYGQQSNDDRHASYDAPSELRGRDSRSIDPSGYRANDERQDQDVQRNRSPPHPPRPPGQVEPPQVMGHGPQMKPPPFVPGMQPPGPMEGMPFPMPPLHPPPLGMPPNVLPLGFGLPLPLGMPPMGMPPMPMPPGAMPMSGPGQDMGASRRGGINNGRVENAMRPKQKPMKQRKRCKYFGTKQGCRDGNACMFAHN